MLYGTARKKWEQEQSKGKESAEKAALMKSPSPSPFPSHECPCSKNQAIVKELCEGVMQGQGVSVFSIPKLRK